MTIHGPIDRTHLYRRRARRLRAVHGQHPARLHRSLKVLCRTVDAALPLPPNEGLGAGDVVGQPIGPASSTAALFATHVAAQFDESILRYSQRRALIRTAESLGIGRFEANLIIATVEHRRRRDLPPPPRPTQNRWTAIATFLAIQSAVAGLVVWIIQS